MHLITEYRIDFATACSTVRNGEIDLYDLTFVDLQMYESLRMCLCVFIFWPMASAQSSRHFSRKVGRFFEEHQTQTSFPSAGPTAFGTLCAKLVSLKSRKS